MGDDGSFEVGSCADLGMFDPDLPDLGLDAFLARSGDLNGYIVLMEDRQPDFFLGYRAFDTGGSAPLNRHGPNKHAWTQAQLRSFVGAAHARGLKVLLGAWIHECDFIDEHHPELLMRGPEGRLWQDVGEQSADFNPLKAMRADAAHEIPEGMRFAEYVVRQYARLQRDFGFDGLFLGDGGMGFREFSHDERGAQYYDFSGDWIQEFAAASGLPADLTPQRILEHHYPAWVAWNVSKWTHFYATLAGAVHASGGRLMAYNVMNFGPAAAYAHAIDYRELAHAGLDVLVFQTYDYAWGPTGPFKPQNKDLSANLHGLLETAASVADTAMKVVFTIETGDSVEQWDAPVAHTVGEAAVYAGARVKAGSGWRPATDGAFVVWANEVPADEWNMLAQVLHGATADRGPIPDEAPLLWDDAQTRTLATRPVSPSEMYPGLDRQRQLGTAAIARREDATPPLRALGTRLRRTRRARVL